MTLDTVFDAASLTKPVVTASLVMRFVEQNKLSLTDPVWKYLPAFGAPDKRAMTIEQLLSHTAGLAPANPLSDFTDRSRYVQRIAARPLRQPPGRARLYSDVGYILLGEVLARVGKKPLQQLAQEEVLLPLGMHDSGFLPTAEQVPRCAPSERARGAGAAGWLRCKVHDPRAQRLGGVAGHAGLFTTAADLSRYVQVLLAMGRVGAREWLTPQSIVTMSAHAQPHSRHALAFFRTPGGGYGHTGFTGTSIWLHPVRGEGLILLTSRLHPHGKGDVRKLRRQLRAWLITLRVPDARSLGMASSGIDAFIAGEDAPLRGKRVGLITHDAARAADGRRSADVLFAAPHVRLTALFSPEHGLGANRHGKVGHTRDARTGLPVYSLYGATARPQAKQLDALDALVFDLQDVGARFYTYLTTLGYALEAAAAQHIPLVVLDRKNPLGGQLVEGPMLDAQRTSFIGYHPLPVRHGMTLGELALFLNTQRQLGAEVHVIKVPRWGGRKVWIRTGQTWYAPSPNLRTVEAAWLYPGLALLEMTNVSVGRGTDRPFMQLGAPWLNAEKLVTALNAEPGLGVHSEAVVFTPTRDKHARTSCRGVRFRVKDAATFRSVHFGLVLVQHLRRLHSRQFRAANVLTLLGNGAAFRALMAGDSAATVEHLGNDALAAFMQRRNNYLLYR